MSNRFLKSIVKCCCRFRYRLRPSVLIVYSRRFTEHLLCHTDGTRTTEGRESPLQRTLQFGVRSGGRWCDESVLEPWGCRGASSSRQREEQRARLG